MSWPDLLNGCKRQRYLGRIADVCKPKVITDAGTQVVCTFQNDLNCTMP